MPEQAQPRVLVAGIGNIFFRDDGFGPAVAAAILCASATAPLPDGVRVVDYGVRGMHLTFDLLAGVAALVLIDAVPSDPVNAESLPGRITVQQIGPDDLGVAEFDAHGMQPVSVLASLESMGAQLPPTYVVGCVPADVSEGIGLSAPVAAVVSKAAGVVADLVGRLVDGPVGVPSVRDRQGGA